MGCAVGDDLVPVRRHTSRRLGGPPGRGRDRPRVQPESRPVSSARGSSSSATTTVRGARCQGIHPRRTNYPLDASTGDVTLLLEAASNPSFPQFRPSPLGSLDTAGEAPIYRFRRAELVVVDPDAEALAYDLEVLDGVMRTLRLDDPRRVKMLRALEACARSAPRRRRRARDRCSRWLDTRPTPTAGPPLDRHRARAHRHRVAVADPRDAAQVRPDVRVGDRVDGRLPRVPVRRVERPALRVDRGVPPRRCSSASPNGSSAASGCRSAACGSRPT